jgi:flagellar motor switch/type III secretory pathway protein FliN
MIQKKFGELFLETYDLYCSSLLLFRQAPDKPEHEILKSIFTESDEPYVMISAEVEYKDKEIGLFNLYIPSKEFKRGIFQKNLQDVVAKEEEKPTKKERREEPKNLSSSIVDNHKVKCSIQLADVWLPIKDLKTMEEGMLVISEVELGTDLVLKLGEEIIAYGETIMTGDDKYGIRITKVR